MTPTGPDAAPSTKVLRARIPAKTAAVDGSEVLGDVADDSTVTGASVTFDAAVTGDGTNNRTLTLRNRGQDGTGTTVVATLALLAGINPALGDEVAMTLSGTPANLSVNAEDVLSIEETHGGAGLANPGASVEVTLARR